MEKKQKESLKIPQREGERESFSVIKLETFTKMMKHHNQLARQNTNAPKFKYNEQ